jgi:hypothetical protein
MALLTILAGQLYPVMGERLYLLMAAVAALGLLLIAAALKKSWRTRPGSAVTTRMGL